MRGMGLLGGLAIGLAIGWLAGKSSDSRERTTRSTLESERDSDRRATSADPRERRSTTKRVDSKPPTSSTRTSDTPTDETIRRMILEGFRIRAGEEASPPQDLVKAAIAEFRRRRRGSASSAAQEIGIALDWRQATREQSGTMTAPPLRLQLRSRTSSATAHLDRRGTSDTPLDVRTPLRETETQATYSDGGLIAPGRALVVERLELDAQVESSLQLVLRPSTWLGWRGPNRKLAFSLVGRTVIHHGEEGRLQVDGFQTVASVIVHGRLVDATAAETIAEQPFRLAGEGNGWLDRRAVVLEVQADSSGAPHRVSLDGALRRVRLLERDSVWTERDDWTTRGARGRYRNAGLVPPGKAYRIRRIEYRARLDKSVLDASSMRISIGDERVAAHGGEHERVRATWTGDVTIRPGEERSVSIAASYNAMIEATIYGELVDD